MDEQDNNAMTYCPDCDVWVPTSGFVQHREAHHPPSLLTLVTSGIPSEESVHGQPPQAA